MNEELLEKTAATRLTRRKIVTTGTKLAYAAPAVAATMKLSSISAHAVHISPGGEHPEGECFHSVAPNRTDEGGCMRACACGCFGECTGEFATENVDGKCNEICSVCTGGNDNPCPSASYCDPTKYPFSGDPNNCSFTG